ncbi:fumarylacetoacetate hydrolase family protein [Paenibacillus sedimenti]|uniref:Fumarylacetoacetate hydrolase family protein n=1 Tax=Paenibacillus sedimenti TaxID=2770274 RepID=A0A926QMI7_9BACL|nr:fumarylacetoacetate hydrolase family protein [Paenibacillus sedimenti]MBD0383968.1 fumarylacetoacetate hydrolase family protein [Paenibacillus sedimenti]
MKLATVKINGEETAAVISDDKVILIKTINEIENKDWSTDLFHILQSDQLSEMNLWYKNEGENELRDFPHIQADEISYAPLYRNPGKILGVGMNYMEKAIELSGKAPEEMPVIFMKPDTSLIGAGEAIQLPAQSSNVTAEAELGIIIGKSCKDVKEEDAYSVVAGFTTTLDMTAKDIHAKNPRYLQLAKSFNTFFSFGPYFITADEFPELKDVTVETVLNGEVHHRNVVANMMYQPGWIVSFISHIMTLYPGDIIMTGTPGSVVIREGDVAQCNIEPFKPLRNPIA